MIVNNLRIQETYLNQTENHIIDETEIYEPFTNDTTVLFKALQCEYGRCIGSVHIDRRFDPSGDTWRIGWIFAKRVHYEDSKDTYTREVWITLYHDTGSEFERLQYDYVKLG